MFVNKCHSEKIQKVLTDFYNHVKETDSIINRTANIEEGEDTHYYELDARIVEPLLELLEKSGQV